ncbi:hypothetical protein NLU13_9019 [Sarocladium strictum]|uniref:Magnesium transporter n=1 Tax=Sarocladium strictum TaxID=5046 RepID=A0AA39G9Q5_SARSR|nr:hypothetical protein NLU13_9019 [Sarocladium strictum]
MAWTARLLTVTGLLFLAHACYSAQEHITLSSNLAHVSENTTSSLPIDIAVETVVATLIVVLGLILSSPQPRPIQWRTWAGKIEREGPNGFRTSSGEVEKDYRGNPYMALESRQSFVDIRKQRREFAEWAKGKQ